MRGDHPSKPIIRKFLEKRKESENRKTDLREKSSLSPRNQHPIQYSDLQDFITCYHPENRHERAETWSEENTDGRWHKFDIADILTRDKTSLDIFWIKDKSLADLDSLPSPDVLTDEIIGNQQSALESFQELKAQLK